NKYIIFYYKIITIRRKTSFPHDKPQPAPNRIALSPAADQKRQTYSLQNFPLSRLRPEYFRVIKHE
ncbi:hypothetical protein, partial [Alistipes putredinis]|uniref:hypothetical protein n=1 Tax=Alistipes putredinis TaxID=28117 RepID=UPI003AB8E9C7